MLSLNCRLRFSANRTVVLHDYALYLLAPGQITVHRSPVIRALCQQIDGQSSAFELIHKLSTEHSEPELLYRIQQLQENGHLITDDQIIPTSEEQRLLEWQQRLQLQISLQLGREVELFLLADPFDKTAIAKLYQRHKAAAELIITHPYGDSPWVSTSLSGEHNACPFCLLFWLRQNRPVERFLARQQGALTLHQAQPVAAEEELLERLSEQLFATLAERVQPLSGSELISWNPQLAEITLHRLQQRPQCGVCGDADWMAQQAGQPIQLREQALSVQSAGLRSEDPSQTYQRLRHLLSPLTGPIVYLHPMPGRHTESRYVYAAGYLNCPRQLSGSNDFDKLCAGKGDRSEQARTSALCETLERFSGHYQGDEPTRRARQVDLVELSYGFDVLQQFSDRQRARRSKINCATRDRRKQIPLGFDRYSRIDWTPAWSLSREEPVWVPLGYCYAETPLDSGAEFGIHNPNGCAAGAHLDEAILQGLLELVERDAVAIWWYNRLLRPRVDLADFAVPYWNTLAKEYAAQGYDFWVLDLTHDLRIPCFTAIASHRDQSHYAIGFGCHLDHRIAINRAITELNQLFDPGPKRVNPWDQSLLTDSDFLAPDPAQSPLGRADFDAYESRSTAEALEECGWRLAQQGMDLLVVNKSRPDLELKVAQVIVPGLRHFWPRFGPGRLYEVPVKLGWRQTPLRETELNPALLFL